MGAVQGATDSGRASRRQSPEDQKASSPGGPLGKIPVQTGKTTRLPGSDHPREAIPRLLPRQRGSGRRRRRAGRPEVLAMLTDCEREFLAAFIYEATTDPFT